jgi:transposase InsO family protein
METAKRARKAETPKQPSLRLRLRAPYLYPNRYLIRDRDGAYGEIFLRRVRSIRIRDRPTSPRSSWQNACAERLIGSIRRECIDHVVVFGERHLRQWHAHAFVVAQLRADITRRRESWTHSLPPDLGGLHHQYSRI